MRKLSLERVYVLGQYKSLRLGDTVEDIPDDLMTNKDFINQIRYLQFIDTEWSYRKYLQVREKFNSMSIEDAIAELDEIRIDITRNIKDILNGGKE